MITDKRSNGNVIFQLQEQLLRVKREFSLKEGDWKRERIILQQKNEITNMELVELKERQISLKKVNQTLSMAQKAPHRDEDPALKDILASLAKTNNLPTTLNNQLSEQRQEEIYRTIKSNFEQKWRDRERAIREDVEEEFQGRIRDLEGIIREQEGRVRQHEGKMREQEGLQRRKYQNDIDRLERDLMDKYEGELDTSRGEVRRWKDETYRLREEIDQLERRSIKTSESSKFLNFINSSKQLGSRRDELNVSNVVSEMLCQVCGYVYSTNEFFEHIQECEREEEDNYEDLLSRRKEIENQLQLLELGEKVKGKGSQITVIIKEDSSKKRKRKDRGYKASSNHGSFTHGLLNQGSLYQGSSPSASPLRRDELSSLKESMRMCRY